MPGTDARAEAAGRWLVYLLAAPVGLAYAGACLGLLVRAFRLAAGV